MGSTDQNVSVSDEFHFDSVDAIFKRFPPELWAAKGKPKLWVKLYGDDGISVWRDFGFGTIRLETPEGVNEGKERVSVRGTFAIFRNQKIDVYVKDSWANSDTSYLGNAKDGSEDDVVELELEA